MQAVIDGDPCAGIEKPAAMSEVDIEFTESRQARDGSVRSTFDGRLPRIDTQNRTAHDYAKHRQRCEDDTFLRLHVESANLALMGPALCRLRRDLLLRFTLRTSANSCRSSNSDNNSKEAASFHLPTPQ